jgi:hypothetical protein
MGPGRGGREGVSKPRRGPGRGGRGEVSKPRGGHQKDVVVEEPRGGPKRGPQPAWEAWWPSRNDP